MQPTPAAAARRDAGSPSVSQTALLLTALLLIVGWVRLVPLQLHGLGARAAGIAYFESRATAELDGTRPDPVAHQARVAQIEAGLREQYTFVADDGRQHVYLSRADGYAWLRFARNQLEHGQPCDRVVDDQCRDELTMAPWGTVTPYGRSPHIQAIVLVHRLLRWWRPGIPLSASAYALTVVLGLAAAVFAFLLGRRLTGSGLAGVTGGLAAGLLASLDYSHLGRTIGADNDGWSIVLLLALLWTATESVLTERWRTALLWMVAASLTSGLWAALWRGWVHGYALVGGLLLGWLAVSTVRRAGAGPRRRTLALLGVYVGATGLCVFAVTGSIADLAAPLTLPLTFVRHLLLRATDTHSASLVWPDAFAYVRELRRARLDDIVWFLGGKVVFGLAYAGLLLTCLPAAGWRRRELLTCAAGAAALLRIVGIPGSGIPAAGTAPWRIVTAIAIPVIAALALHAWNRRAGTGIVAGLVLAPWCLSTLLLALQAERFGMLFSVAWAIAAGVAIGRTVGWLHQRLEQRTPITRWLGAAALVAGVVGVLFQLGRHGVQIAWYHDPGLGDAEVATLEQIRDGYPSDAIVTDLFGGGYRVKYFANRRVHHDGGTLGSHVFYWVARLYATTDERTAVGILRMLNCGSDALPRPEGDYGALARLQGAGKSPAAAFALLDQILTLDRAPAAQQLRESGLGPEAIAAVLARSHCQPPQSLVLTSSDRFQRLDGWLDPGRLHPRATAPQPTALAAPSPIWPGYRPHWQPCRSNFRGTRELGCSVHLPQVIPEAWLLTVDLDRPEAARVHLRSQQTLRPALVAIAEGGHLRYFQPPAPELPEVGVLVDRAGGRVLIAPAEALRTTMTRLLWVDGYQSRYFELQADHRDPHGETVKLWRVKRWQTAAP